MSYTKMLKQAEKAYKARMKKENIEREEARIKQAKTDMLIRAAMYREEKAQIKALEEEEKRIVQCKNDIRDTLAGTLPYKLWIVCYDLLCDNWYQIESDIQRGKITLEEVEEVKAKMNSIHNIIGYQFA
ncbi:MAG: hypothetical protein ACRDD7_11620 [Peptostreptococcaceae bacterium]